MTEKGDDLPLDPINASWLAIGIVALGAMIFVTSEFLPIGLLPDISGDIDISRGEVGLMLTAPGAAAAIAAPLTIAILGNVDRRKLLARALALLCASNLLVALSESFVILMIARAMMGIGLGCFWAIAGSLGPRVRQGAQGAVATAVILSGISLGNIIGVPAGVLMSGFMSWREVFLTCALIAGLAAVLLLLLMPPIAPQKGSGLRSARELLERGSSRAALVAMLLLFAGQFCAYTYVSPYLGTKGSFPTQTLASVLLLYGCAGLLGNLIGGWLAARGDRHAVMLTASMLAGAMIMLVVASRSFSTVVLCVAVWGLSFGMLPVTVQTFMLNSARDHLEVAAAMLVSTIQIAIALGSALGGFVADHFGLQFSIVVGGCLAATIAGHFLIEDFRNLRKNGRSPQPGVE